MEKKMNMSNTRIAQPVELANMDTGAFSAAAQVMRRTAISRID